MSSPGRSLHCTALSRSRVEPRGVGLFDSGEGDLYDLETAIADAEAIAGEARVHVVGASFGAAAAVGLALKAPLAVRSLTLVAPLLLRRGPRLLAVIDAWYVVAAAAPPHTLARTIIPWFFSSTFLDDAAKRERAQAFAQSAERTPAHALSRARRSRIQPNMGALRRSIELWRA